MAESAGERLVQEWRREYPWATGEAGDADLARRIDAALAEAARELKELETFRAEHFRAFRNLLGDHESPDEAIAGNMCAILPLTLCEFVLRDDTALAEREAQCVALREALLAIRPGESCYCTGRASGAGREHEVECDQAQDVLAATADAAAHFVARARQEGAEEMQERCLEIASHGRHDDHDPARCTGCAIRGRILALDAGALAARRG